MLNIINNDCYLNIIIIVTFPLNTRRLSFRTYAQSYQFYIIYIYLQL